MKCKLGYFILSRSNICRSEFKRSVMKNSKSIRLSTHYYRVLPELKIKG